MKYLMMYLVCGILWSAYWTLDGLGAEEVQKYLNDQTEDIRKIWFKSGVIIRFETIRKMLVGFTFGYLALTWPWNLIDEYVIRKIKNRIKKH